MSILKVDHMLESNLEIKWQGWPKLRSSKVLEWLEENSMDQLRTQVANAAVGR